MSDIESQFEPIAHEYAVVEKDAEKSQYELKVNWPSIKSLMPQEPVKVLDYGCGAGVYSVLMANDGYEVTAIDNSPSILEEFNDSRIVTKKWGYTDKPLSETFDLIIAKLVLQFVEDLSGFALAMRRQLNTGGRLIVSVPHPDKSRLIANGNREYETLIGISGLRVTMIHRELEEYKSTFQKAGLELLKTDEPFDPKVPKETKRLNMLFGVTT